MSDQGNGAGRGLQLPTFVVVGAAKCGTTSLGSYLGQHPDVFMSAPKEPHFFTHSWKKGVDFYASLFASATEPARGEASTSYSQAPHGFSVPERMASVIPDAKLIYLLRHPIDRIRSQYVHWVSGGKEYRPIEEALREDPRYIEHTRYAHQLQLFLEFYPRDRILVLENTELRNDARGVLDRTFEFIGVDPARLSSVESRDLNRGADKRRTYAPLRGLRETVRREGLLRGLPAPLKKKLHSMTSSSIEKNEVEIPSGLRESLWEQLSDDRQQLRDFVPASFPDWEP